MIVLIPLICIVYRNLVREVGTFINEVKFLYFKRRSFNPDSFLVWGSSKFNGYDELKPSAEYIGLLNDLKFYPPVYVQRYHAVANILEQPRWKGGIKKVVEFGCAELSFFIFLKNINGIEQVLEVDIDEEVLKQNAIKSTPLTVDHLDRRTTPFSSCVLQGSVAEYDECLSDVDVVVAIELIEHLYPDVLKLVPRNIFELIQPRLVIITTPNSDFNVLFPNLVGFRNDDHKFEWSRSQFYNWAQDIVKMYPCYTVEFYGIGCGPEGTEELGCCSQMAVFYRSPDAIKLPVKEIDVKSYKVVKQSTFPVYVDKRSKEEKIVDEVRYRVSSLGQNSNFYNYDTDKVEIPLTYLLKFVGDLCSSVSCLSDILLNNSYEIMEYSSGPVLIKSDRNGSEDDENDSWQEEDAGFNEISEDRERVSQFEEECDWDICRQLDKTTSDSCSVIQCKGDGGRKRNFEECLFPVEPVDLLKSSKFSVRPHSSYIRKSPKKISKSCSLDSCLENINCEPIEMQAFYLNLLSNGVVSPVVDSQSYDKCVDSGCPLSVPSPDEYEVRSSTSESSLTDDEEGERQIDDERVGRVDVDNGDLANNNRDGEGNNIDPVILPNNQNDNMAVIQQFPPWLLNLGELVPPQLIDEGLGVDTTSSEDEADELDLDISAVNISSDRSDIR